MNEVFLDGPHPVGWVSSLNDEKFLKEIIRAEVEREQKEEEHRNLIRSGVLPKPEHTKTLDISDRD